MSKKSEEAQHAVIVHFNYLTDNLDALYELEDKLESLLADEQFGEYDGHEIATDYADGFLYLYGTNAEELFKLIKPILGNTDFTRGAVVKLIFGEVDSGAKEIEIEIDK